MWELVQIADTIEAFCKTEKLSKNKCKILDVGCGLGRISLPLAHLGYNIVGVDVDSTVIDAAGESARNLNNIRFVNSDALSFFSSYKGEQFHAIICSHVLEHVENPLKLIRAFSNGLKFHGMLICIIPNPFALLELCILRPQGKLKKLLNMESPQGRDHISGVSLAWLTKAIELCGFEIQSVLPVGSILANPLTSRTKIEMIELQSPKPKALAWSWVIVGKKLNE
jgi:ubiquinone/menaquinone biosynthesis C-methylase UbiE